MSLWDVSFIVENKRHKMPMARSHEGDSEGSRGTEPHMQQPFPMCRCVWFSKSYARYSFSGNSSGGVFSVVRCPCGICKCHRLWVSVGTGPWGRKERACLEQGGEGALFVNAAHWYIGVCICVHNGRVTGRSGREVGVTLGSAGSARPLELSVGRWPPWDSAFRVNPRQVQRAGEAVFRKMPGCSQSWPGATRGWVTYLTIVL